MQVTRSPNYETGRTAEYSARDYLRSKGYEVLHIADAHGPFDLIAWRNKTDLLLIQIKSSRVNVDVSFYQQEIETLVHLVSDGTIPGDIQFWFRSKWNWHRYQILPGGFLPVVEVT